MIAHFPISHCRTVDSRLRFLGMTFGYPRTRIKVTRRVRRDDGLVGNLFYRNDVFFIPRKRIICKSSYIHPMKQNRRIKPVLCIFPHATFCGFHISARDHRPFCTTVAVTSRLLSLRRKSISLSEGIRVERSVR